MLVNGYEIGEKPTHDEFVTYYKVKRYFENEFVAEWLEGKPHLTKIEFYDLCAARNRTMESSDEEGWALFHAYEELMAWKDYTEGRTMEENSCPECGSHDCINVASGVDEFGEWRSAECEKCGSTWVYR